MSDSLSKQEKRKIANKKYYEKNKQKEVSTNDPVPPTPQPQPTNNNIDIQQLMKVAYENGKKSVKQYEETESESESDNDTDEELEKYVQMRIKKATSERFLDKSRKKKHKLKENSNELWGTVQSEVMKYGVMLAVPLLYKSVGGMLLNRSSGQREKNSLPQYGF